MDDKTMQVCTDTPTSDTQTLGSMRSYSEINNKLKSHPSVGDVVLDNIINAPAKKPVLKGAVTKVNSTNALQNDIIKKRFSVLKKKASIEVGLDPDANPNRVSVQDQL